MQNDQPRTYETPVGETITVPVHQNAAISIQKRKKPMHPPKPLTPIVSVEDSSSSCSVTSKSVSASKHRPIGSKHRLEDSLSCTKRTLIFERLRVKGVEKKKPVQSSNSKLRVPRNNKPPLPPTHIFFESFKSIREVNEMMDKLHEYMVNLEKGGTLTIRSPFVSEIQKEVLPFNVR